ncbi:MAG: polysaccharide deacetylase family protein [Rhodococcus sp.]|nr:polysaccharide deacetylase family protein [Rhodococcus sp. (in: high G+C Gram-positive bacteria)]
MEAVSVDPPGGALSNVIDRQRVIDRFTGVAPSQWGTHLPGVATHVDGGALALTFDGCGGGSGSGVDHALLDLLAREQIPATFFLNRRWIDTHPALTTQLSESPLFTIENHGTTHAPLSVNGRSAYGIAGTASVAAAVDEVLGNHYRIEELTGRTPQWFRAGTAHYDDVAVQVVAELGLGVAGFAVNGDAGATFHANQVRNALVQAQPGSIVLMHLNHPGSGVAEGVAAAVPALRASGTHFTTL